MTKEENGPESFVFQRTVNEVAPMLVDADGMYITYEDPKTKEQKTVIDAMTGAAVGSLGHKDKEIVDYMGEAAKNSFYSFGMYFSNYAAEDLSKFLIEKSPKGHFSSALWVGSGSEANENALKIAKQYHNERNDRKRFRFISRKNAYHGFTIGALSIGDGVRKEDFKQILLSDEQTPKVSACNPYRGITKTVSEEQYTEQLLKELEDTFIANDPTTVAGVIFETVGGSSFGTVPPPKGYLDGARDLCHKYGALFMLDEVMCGLGRSGNYHTYTKFMESGNGPDLMTIGKTIGSGYVTLAGVLISPLVKDAIVKGSNAVSGAQTYHCHEFNCKIGLAVQKKLDRDNLIPKAAKVGQYIMDTVGEKLKDSKIVGDIRGLPLFFSLEFCDPSTKKSFPAEWKVAYKVADKALENGITTMGMQGTNGATVDAKGETVGLGDHLSIAPAYIITEKEADIIIEALVKAVKDTEAELPL
ncbi:DEKNAAC105426 [Brettanomyces naardenensis]|uniref:DEKNAAC105426 n=1 Tax=Brettanomyces naardenensis TaxID=13370 RepID=A0A448YTI0_BRENA|nr:DEKNAAC105426 [Brettanomyces naardenensis]